MTEGACTLTNYGTFDVSGAALKSKVDTIVLTGGLSGAAVYLVPTTPHQVQVIKVDVR